jgi:hypothetical protein
LTKGWLGAAHTDWPAPPTSLPFKMAAYRPTQQEKLLLGVIAAQAGAEDLPALCIHLNYFPRLRKRFRSSNLLERSLRK